MSKHEGKYDFKAPESMKEAKERINALTIDVMNVEKQLGDRRKVKSMPEHAYDAWREKTKAARIFQVAQLRFLKEWCLARRLAHAEKDADAQSAGQTLDPRALLHRARVEGRKLLRGEKNAFLEVLDAIDLSLDHVA